MSFLLKPFPADEALSHVKKYKFQLNCARCGNRFVSNVRARFCPDCAGHVGKFEDSFISRGKVIPKKALPVPKLTYKLELMTLNSKTVKAFVFPENRRKIRSTKVDGLRLSLLAGSHWETPLVVNKLGKDLRVLDGNHRVTALLSVLERFSGFSLESYVAFYEGLDEDREIEVFRKWNSGTFQTTDDFLQSISKKVVFLQLLKKDFPLPVTVYKETGTVYARILCNSMLAAKRLDEMGTGFNKENLFRELGGLTEKDHAFLKEWALNFLKIFGKPTGRNPYYKANLLFATIYIAYENSNAAETWSLLKENVKGDAEIMEFLQYGGKEAKKKALQMIKAKMLGEEDEPPESQDEDDWDKKFEGGGEE